MIYLIHGEDSLTRREAVRALMPAPTDDEYAAMSLFDGNVDVQQIIEACDALPFLSDRRYVLVRGFIAGQTRRKRASEDEEQGDPETEPALGTGKRPMQVLRDYLPALPSTTTLVLEEPSKVASTSVLFKYIKANGEERECRPLQGAELSRWIVRQFEDRGAPVHPVAVETLMAYVGPDLLLLDHEIEKLVAFAAGRTVQAEDVAEMVSSAEETRVWSMIDALAQGRSDAALLLLRKVLEDNANPPLRTLGAIVSRFRSMLLVKELADLRLPDVAIAQRTGQTDWSVRNTRPLLRHFSLPQLKLIYERLLETDIALKNSPIDPKLTLELLVIEVARRNSQAAVPAGRN